MVACQAPLPMEFSRQEYWSGLPCLSLGDLPWPRDQTRVSHTAGRFFTIWATRNAPKVARWGLKSHKNNMNSKLTLPRYILLSHPPTLQLDKNWKERVGLKVHNLMHHYTVKFNNFQADIILEQCIVAEQSLRSPVFSSHWLLGVAWLIRSVHSKAHSCSVFHGSRADLQEMCNLGKMQIVLLTWLSIVIVDETRI